MLATEQVKMIKLIPYHNKITKIMLKKICINNEIRMKIYEGK